MCRLFIFNSNTNTSADPAVDACKFKLGHVIEVLEDGQNGGAEVEGKKAKGLFQIIEIPGVPASKYRYLCDGDPQNTDTVKTTHPRLRINVLDIAALKAVIPVDVNGKIVVANEKAMTDLITVTTPVVKESVIGDDPSVIG